LVFVFQASMGDFLFALSTEFDFSNYSMVYELVYDS
jgi:hypothetical protein